MNKFIPPIVLTLILAGVLLGLLNTGALLPEAASADAGMIDALFELEFQIIAIVFAFCMAFLFYSLWHFRRRPGEEGDGEHFEENTPLEVTWTLAPLALVLLLAFFTAGQHNDLIQAEPNEKPITVIASQWSWSFIYTEGVTTQNELWLLVDQAVVMNITAPDSNVIHSFYIPEFRLKQDAVPGTPTVLRFTPTVIGEYNVLCAELCGSSDITIDENGDNIDNTSHASMLAAVHVVDQEAYNAWLAENGVLSETTVADTDDDSDDSADADDDDGDDAVVGDAAAGETVALMNGCTGCHANSEAMEGVIVTGPSWVGLYGSEETLDDGSVVLVDAEYLRASIVDPNAVITEGFSGGIMPPAFGDSLTEDDINNIIAYIASLSE